MKPKNQNKDNCQFLLKICIASEHNLSKNTILTNPTKKREIPTCKGIQNASNQHSQRAQMQRNLIK